jgi:hypothetical protein
VLKATSRPLYSQEKDPLLIVQEAAWASGPLLMCPKTLAPHRISNPGPGIDIASNLDRHTSCYRSYVLFLSSQDFYNILSLAS